MKIIKEYSLFFWLGLSLGVVGFSIMDWQWWFVFLPAVILIYWGDEK